MSLSFLDFIEKAFPIVGEVGFFIFLPDRKAKVHGSDFLRTLHKHACVSIFLEKQKDRA